MADQIRGLLPDGTLPSAALAQVQGIVDESAGVGVPVLSSVEEAVAWEAANPGRVALYFVEGEAPVAPEPPADGVAGLAHQWVAADVADPVDGWTDRVAGVQLAYVPMSDNQVSRDGDALKFGGTSSSGTHGGFGPVALSDLGEQFTIVTATRASAAEQMGFVVGLNRTSIAGVATPAGGLAEGGMYATGLSGGITSTGKHAQAIDGTVVTARWAGASSALTAGTESKALTAPAVAVTDFNIGSSYGQVNGRYIGSIYEVRVYDRRLSDDDVTTLHAVLADTYGLVL